MDNQKSGENKGDTKCLACSSLDTKVKIYS